MLQIKCLSVQLESFLGLGLHFMGMPRGAELEQTVTCLNNIDITEHCGVFWLVVFFTELCL